MIDLTNLRFFYHVAKGLSFQSAASELFVSPSAVTKRIKAFEEKCNLTLFGRKRGKTFLTEEGKILFEYADKLFKNEKEIEKAINDIREFKRGFLRLGLPKTFMPSAMSFLMDTYHNKYPKIQIQINAGNSGEILEGLLKHTNEIAIMAKTDERSDIEFIPQMREKAFFYISTDHPLTKKKSVSLEELTEQPLIVREKGSGLRKLALEFFEKNKCEPNILLETSHVEYIKRLIQRGDGISMMLEKSVDSDVKQGTMKGLSVKGYDIFFDLYFAHLKNVHLSLPAKEFIKLFSRLEDEMPGD